MGAWGYAPDDNDSVMDWIDYIQSGSSSTWNKFLQLIKKKRPNIDDKFTRFGVVYGLLKRRVKVPHYMIHVAIGDGQDLLNDPGDWDNVKEYMKQTRRAVSYLRKKVR